MLHTYVCRLRQRVNANGILGYPPGTLLCASVSAGGGFAGSASHITVWARNAGWPEDLFERVEFPKHDEKSYDYSVWQEDGLFYLESHRLKYNWTFPVTDSQKNKEK